MFGKPKSKSRHFKSTNHKILDDHKHIKFTIDNPNIDNIDGIFYTCNNEYDNKHEFYLVRCEFILSFKLMEGYRVASSKLTDNKTVVSRKISVENIINDFKNAGFVFSHISQINIIIVCKKMDLTYDFHIKHNMHAVEWKLNKLIDEDKNLINKLPLT